MGMGLAVASVTALGTPAPSVSTILPAAGSILGGLAVTLTGRGFTGATAVKINGVSCTLVVVVSDGVLTALTPVTTAGTWNVTVTTPVGTGTLPNGFTSS